MTSIRSKGPWWRDAVTYQIYIRSFADGSGDGIGDVAGIRSRLGYLKKLGIDAIWITPWYPSPQKDHGYDVSDYLNIEPDYGDVSQAEALIKETHDAGMRIIIDIVPNHSSNQHIWFQEALASPPGSKERARYIFKEGKGKNGEIPPNNWQAIFGGPAWERVVEADGSLGEWYLHLFAVEQPDFNWHNQEVKDYFEKVLRFWLDRGVDGFRIDVAHGMIKAEGFPDVKLDPKTQMLSREDRPFFDQDGVHEIYREWRRIFDSYPGERMGVAEAWVSPIERIARYLRKDVLNNSFNFDFLTCKWDSQALKKTIDRSIEVLREVEAPASWVFNNHDVVRSVDRFDLGLTSHGATTLERQGDPEKLNLARGIKRARSGALLMLALPGGAYIFQGEELTLPEVRDIPQDRLTDPFWKMSGFKDRGRDGCRVPLPWSEDEAGGFGFSSNHELSLNDLWLPQSEWMKDFAASKQEKDPNSSLNIYRKALAIRKSHPALGDGEMAWIETPETVLAFSRPGGFACYVNFGKEFTLPENAKVLVSSEPIDDGVLPPDAAVWLEI
jgi:alpha-glucosidase